MAEAYDTAHKRAQVLRRRNRLLLYIHTLAQLVIAIVVILLLSVFLAAIAKLVWRALQIGWAIWW